MKKKRIFLSCAGLLLLAGAQAAEHGETRPVATEQPAAELRERPRTAEADERTEQGVALRQHFLPMRRRIDREINRGRFAYRGELIGGLTASYGTLSSEDTEFMVILDGLDLDGTIASVRPYLGYFYRDNRCLGIRFGYQHMDGNLGNASLDLGEQNDVQFDLGGLSLDNDSYSFGLFHRSYVGLDRRGRFGLFAELEVSATIGSGRFVNASGDTSKETHSDNVRLSVDFNPGMAVYIFPNVCATVSIGLGGLQYNSIRQHDAEGNFIGSRRASKMRFRLNIADISLGMVVHFWDTKRH